MTNTAYQVGSTFRLIGRTTKFVATRTFDAAGFIPSVEGHTFEGRPLRTVARVADVIFLDLIPGPAIAGVSRRACQVLAGAVREAA